MLMNWLTLIKMNVLQYLARNDSHSPGLCGLHIFCGIERRISADRTSCINYSDTGQHQLMLNSRPGPTPSSARAGLLAHVRCQTGLRSLSSNHREKLLNHAWRIIKC